MHAGEKKKITGILDSVEEEDADSSEDNDFAEDDEDEKIRRGDEVAEPKAIQEL